jgi:SAM-dependent methyltransferase
VNANHVLGASESPSATGPRARGSTLKKLTIMDGAEKVPFLSALVRRQGGAEPIDILEAGCGHRWLLQLEGKRFRLTGVDLDKDALEIRKNVRKDLDEAIHGDLRTIEFGDRRFDVIYSAFVLEHIDRAEAVLSRMTGWLKPGGLIIVEIPDPDSVKGIVTRVTPHWFHVLYYRVILGLETAGRPGHGPYRTYFDPVVSRRGMYAFAEKHGLDVEAEYAFETWGPRKRAMRVFAGTMTRLVSGLTLGKYSDRHADLLYVLRRRA